MILNLNNFRDKLRHQREKSCSINMDIPDIGDKYLKCKEAKGYKNRGYILIINVGDEHVISIFSVYLCDCK